MVRANNEPHTWLRNPHSLPTVPVCPQNRRKRRPGYAERMEQRRMQGSPAKPRK